MQPNNANPTVPSTRQRKRARSAWIRTVVAWHWISSAVSLVGMLLFALTGITLNHASQIESEPEVRQVSVVLPEELHAVLRETDVSGLAGFPNEVETYLGKQLSVAIGSRQAEWSDHEIYLSMPGPGADAWLAIDRESGEVEFEETRRGWIAYFNDLHKGRNTGAVWKWVLDLFSVAMLVFCLTGLILLMVHAKRRRMTWPLVALGVVAPFIVMLLLIH